MDPTQNNKIDDPRPVAPIAPSPNECCNSGCDPCIFDFYSEELQEYRLKLAEWELRQASGV
ncbi:oxidoreductase-like domain-containing protein [Chitinimonas sp. PSY-7]|uniref:oxidoreductase-like domain-containing protein n=1 Tax=Chitinimonas sp. PSY-7 TaxID=3459088 RepID=UPI00403FF947